MKIGLVGYGRLGEFISKFLMQDFELFVVETNLDRRHKLEQTAAKFVEIKHLAICDAIILCVPISKTLDIIKKISKLNTQKMLVIDTCSVKVQPTEWMLEFLPKTWSILATHPMFGPDSAKETLLGRKIVICDVRIQAKWYQEIYAYLNSHGLLVVKSTPDEHDKQIAKSLLLTHFVGRTLLDYDAHSLEIDTKGYRRLMNILKTVENDSFELFLDMNKYNPYAKETIEKFYSSFQNVLKQIKRQVL